MVDAKRSVLIVDSNSDNLRVFTKIFQKNSYYVTAAETGKAALEQLIVNNFDVALVDFSLLDMNCADVLAQVQKTSPATFLILLTLSPDELALGAHVVVEKPVKPEVLLAIINERFKQK